MRDRPRTSEPRARLRAALRAFVDAPDPGAFDGLAARLLRFQVETIPPFARLVAARGGLHADWREAPLVPTAIFREIDLDNLEPGEVPEAVFRTSGTTTAGERRGRRRVRDLGLYHAGAWAPFVQHVLAGDTTPRPWVCLLASPERSPDSSLGHMVATLAEDLSTPHGCSWHLGPRGLDTTAARARLVELARRGEPVVILATSFALVALLDAGPEPIRLPEGSRLMLTGGFKGRSRVLREADLLDATRDRLGLEPDAVVPEYGMTELSSQAYGRPFVMPPWLKARVLDPVDLRPVPAGRAGLVALFDLLNLDNVASILTGDLGALDPSGRLTLRGRAPGAVLRGCSLTAEELGVLSVP